MNGIATRLGTLAALSLGSIAAISCSDGPAPLGTETVGKVQQPLACGYRTYFQLMATNASLPLQVYQGYDPSCGGWRQITGVPDAMANDLAYHKPGLGAVNLVRGQQYDIFYTGTANNLVHVYTRDGAQTWWPDNGWGAPAGYNIYGQIGAASWGSLRLDVFVLGRQKALTDSSDDPSTSVWHRYWDNGFFSEWQWVGPAASYSSLVAQGVSAVSWGVGRIDLFGVRPGYQSGLNHWYCQTGTICNQAIWSSDTWSTTDTVTSPPAVTYHGSGTLDVFYLGYNGSTQNIKHVWFPGPPNEESWGNPCGANHINPYVGATEDVYDNGQYLGYVEAQTACDEASSISRDLYLGGEFAGSNFLGWSYEGFTTNPLWPGAVIGAGALLYENP